MPSPRATPLSPRQETFCHSYVYFPNAANAAREAGYEAASARQQGYRLLRAPAIAARIAAIRQRMADDGCRETGVLLGKLENVHNRAIEDRHYVAAARAVEIQARLAGLMPSVNERRRDGGGPRPAGGGEQLGDSAIGWNRVVATPTQPSPLEGEGYLAGNTTEFASPLVGEGGVGGNALAPLDRATRRNDDK